MAGTAVLEAFEAKTPCEQASEMVDEARAHADQLRFYFRLVVGAAAIGIVVAIALFIVGQNGAGVASGVSGVVASGAAVFIKNAVDESVTASQKALRLQAKICGAVP